MTDRLGDPPTEGIPEKHVTTRVREAPLVPESQPAVGNKEKLKWLKQTYEGYEENCRFWRFIRLAREGGWAWFKAGNLPAHSVEIRQNDEQDVAKKSEPRESEGESEFSTRNEYDLRVEYGARFNLVADVLQTYMGILGAHPPELKPPPALKRWVDACDITEELSLDEMATESLERAMLMGVDYAGLDKTLNAEQVDEVLETIEPDERGRVPMTVLPDNRPFMYQIEPENVMDGVHDLETGELLEVKVREVVHNGKSLDTMESAYVDKYRYWTKEAWELWRIDRKGQYGAEEAVLEDSGVNEYGFVPVLPNLIFRGGFWRVRAVVEDVALVDRQMAEMLTSLGFSLANDSDTQVYVQADLSEVEDDDNLFKRFVTQIRDALGARRMIFDKEMTPGVLRKESGQRSLMLSALKDVMMMQYRMLGLSDKVSDGSGESGVARTKRYRILSGALRVMSEAKARQMKCVMERAGAMYDGSREVAKLPPDVAMAPTVFDVTAPDEMVDLWKESKGRIPPNWEKELIYDIFVKTAWVGKSASFMGERRAELDEFEFPETPEQLMASMSVEERMAEKELEEANVAEFGTEEPEGPDEPGPPPGPVGTIS